MRTIYKYPIGDASVLTLELDDPKVVLVAPQGDSSFPIVWVEHGLGDPDTKLTLVVHGTGHLIDEGTHVGSTVSGPFVWHVYELRETL